MRGAAPARAQRLLGGWSANLVQLALGITQQIVLVPIFLHFTSREVLAAWLAIYAAGTLAQIADVGLQIRAMNRFLAFKTSRDPDGRTASYYAAVQRIYCALVAIWIGSVVVGAALLRPSAVFGFSAVSDFDVSFVIMIAGALLGLPSNLAAALYRARGCYARAVWMGCAAMLSSQLGQIVALMATARLGAVTAAYVVPQIAVVFYFMRVDAHRLFPFLRKSSRRSFPAPTSWSWIGGQFRRAFPFAIASSTEIALQNLPVLLVSALVIDRGAVAQWGLTRIAAGLVKGLCTQATLPLAAELGHDHAVGARAQLRRLYARGSALVTLLAGVTVAGILAFWPYFLALWTHGLVPYDPLLTATLLLGAAVVAPSVLALSFAYYSDRGELLARAKGVQLIAFVVLALVLTPPFGPLGMAFAIVATDVLIQLGFVGLAVIWRALDHPLAHLFFLAALLLLVLVAAGGLGLLITALVPGTGLVSFVVECALWLVPFVIGTLCLLNPRLRSRLGDMVPN